MNLGLPRRLASTLVVPVLCGLALLVPVAVSTHAGTSQSPTAATADSALVLTPQGDGFHW
jgi:uncharacterized membrane protein